MPDTSKQLRNLRCREVLISIRRIIRAIDKHSHFLAKSFALTGPQLYVLQALAEAALASPGELAKTCAISQTTMTGILKRLEKRGLLVRHPSPDDKRSVRVELTDEGRKLLAQTPPDLQESFVNAFGGLRDWEQSQIVSTLQRVVAMMEATDLDATPILATGTIDQLLPVPTDDNLPRA